MKPELHRSLRRAILAALAALPAVGVALPRVASAQEYRYRPIEERAAYPLELEPHFTFGAGDVYGATGYGAGLRLGVPLVVGSLGRHVADNLAISFGGDVVHYDNCYWGGYCGASYLMIPVAAQWNVFLARRLDLFAEGGVYLYKGFFTACAPGDAGCGAPSDFGVLPTLALGARFHASDAVAITARLGYPTMTLGVSFM